MAGSLYSGARVGGGGRPRRRPGPSGGRRGGPAPPLPVGRRGPDQALPASLPPGGGARPVPSLPRAAGSPRALLAAEQRAPRAGGDSPRHGPGAAGDRRWGDAQIDRQIARPARPRPHLSHAAAAQGAGPARTGCRPWAQTATLSPSAAAVVLPAPASDRDAAPLPPAHPSGAGGVFAGAPSPGAGETLGSGRL